MDREGVSQQNSYVRPPVVVVLGHVDHGKTTLLDAIRKTNEASREAGGITQRIGASIAITQNKRRITFIDTPGHAAFTQMRSRGVEVADIAILVVAADDGVQPQTKEALKIIREAQIPFIVAITKTDLPSANMEVVRDELEKEGVAFEKRGGDVPLIPVSAKKGEGINELLEIILLVSDLANIKTKIEAPLEAVVIETSKDRRGILVSVIVKNGVLKKGQKISADGNTCKIRGLFNDKNIKVDSIYPGEPALILGFESFPAVGSLITQVGNIDKKVTEAPFWKAKEPKKEGLPIILKTQSAGVMESILENLPEKVIVVAAGVGEVNETDVFTAKTTGTKYIFVFAAKVPSSVKKLAETEGVKIEEYEVIYELFRRFEELLKEGQEKVIGKAQILATFPFDGRKVAGCKVIEGEISKVNKLILKRADKILGEVKIISMKRQKQDINIAKVGEEFGVLIEPELDFVIGDMILSVAK